MPNCLADNISLYCGGPYERFACSLVYEDLFTRPRLRQLRRAPFAARLGWERPATDCDKRIHSLYTECVSVYVYVCACASTCVGVRVCGCVNVCVHVCVLLSTDVWHF